jgi:peroxiredoxin Q/BCP
MSGRKARAARQAVRADLGPTRSEGARKGFWTSWKGAVAGLVVALVIAGSFVLPDALRTEPTAPSQAGREMGAAAGEGLPAGSPVPAFSERDVETGKAITSASVYGRKTLLFFSEGVMCQACFEQIRGLEKFGAELEMRGIRLVSITPDSPSDLRQAVSHYGITTPMIADDDRDMSGAFNTLGKGMHGDTPGHAFALVSKGKVLWYRDYWLPPDESMYVKPEKLLADIPTLGASSAQEE